MWQACNRFMAVAAAWSNVAQLAHCLEAGNSRQEALDSPGGDEQGLVGWIVQGGTCCQPSDVAIHVGGGGTGAARDIDRRASWARRDDNLQLKELFV